MAAILAWIAGGQADAIGRKPRLLLIAVGRKAPLGSNAGVRLRISSVALFRRSTAAAEVPDFVALVSAKAAPWSTSAPAPCPAPKGIPGFRPTIHSRVLPLLPAGRAPGAKPRPGFLITGDGYILAMPHVADMDEVTIRLVDNANSRRRWWASTGARGLVKIMTRACAR
jgi:hypothetical protein